MTLSAYLGLLSLGSTIQTRHNAECQREEEQELNSLRRMAQAIYRAETDTVSTVSIHNAPSERIGKRKLCKNYNLRKRKLTLTKVEVRENISGVILAIGTMVANYSLCFPIVAARHRLQALPTLHSYKRDTPRYGASTILYTYRQGGLCRLYPGFGLGLLGQTLSATYESALNQVMSSAHNKANSKTNKLLQLCITTLSKILTLAVNIPLYPLYRNALLLRVQTDSEKTRMIIHTPKDFMRLYKQDLKAFLQPPYMDDKRHVVSAFLPSCILNIITEKLLIYIYRHLFSRVSASSSSSNSDSSFGGSSSSSSNNSKDSTSKKKKDSTVLHTFYPEIACGVISSIITRAVSYPVDTVIFKLMVQDSGVLLENTTYKGFFDCVIRTWKEEGEWKAFYPGWGIGLLEIGMGYVVLELSWLAYQGIQWKLSTSTTTDKHDYNTRAVRKARRLRDRLG